MIGIDTNILVRFITNDEPRQSQKAKVFFEQYLGQMHSLFVNNIVLCEMIWVLKRGYKYDKKLLVHILKQLVSTSEFCFEDIQCIHQAIVHYTIGNADFSDYLIAAINNHKGCQNTYSFDKRAHKVFNVFS